MNRCAIFITRLRQKFSRSKIILKSQTLRREPLVAKSFFIQTWGCQMNDHDGEKITGLMLQAGHTLAQDPDKADIILLNTCSIREKAVHKVYSDLGRWNIIKQRRPLTIGVTGCLAQQEKELLFERAPYVDFVLGTMALEQLPNLIRQHESGVRHAIDVHEYPDNHLFPKEITRRNPAAKGLVTIVEGCNHACTYCIVPTTRGIERSRPFEDIVDEVKELVSSGFKEIELLGQNVNSYNGGCNFADLLRRVCDLDGLEWLRFTTSHPMNFTQDLATAIVTNPKIAPFLHLPVQSGSNKILKRMLREYTIEDYLHRINFLGNHRANLVLSTDFIVGFPGETDEDFQATADLLSTVKFEASFSYIYSPRPGTAALRLKDDLPYSVKQERLAHLQSLQTAQTYKDNQRLIGTKMLARIETSEPRPEGHWIARTGSSKTVHLSSKESNLKLGELVRVQVDDASPHFLKAVLAHD